jgi:hypothetical protein
MDEMRNCPDCGTKPFETHLRGCDLELCSTCGQQRLHCGCRKHDPCFARWTGYFVGELEAKALGLNEQEFYAKFGDSFSIKPRKMAGYMERVLPKRRLFSLSA